MKNLLLFTFFLMLLASCQKSDEAVSNSDSKLLEQRSQQPRAFKAKLESSINPGNQLTECSGDLPGFAIPDHFLAGEATHLGKLKTVLSTLHHENCDLSFATMTLTTAVSGQLTGANGDLITYTGNDVIDVSGLILGNNTNGAINGEWTITGGTGKFSDASGSFTIKGVVNFISGTFTAEAEGIIVY